jgi:ketosteroid isomerase-like protein
MRPAPIVLQRALLQRALSLACMSATIAVVGCASMQRESARESLLAAERAFALDARVRGVRAAFLASFGDDGVAFEPAPVNLRATWSARLEPADAQALQLVWTPVIGDVARSGDFGYTTGPYTLIVNASGARRDGVYFSVWQRDSAGVWKVALDDGIETPSATVPAGFGREPMSGAAPGITNVAASVREIRTLESTIANAASYAALFADDVHVHAGGAAPILGHEAAVRWLTEDSEPTAMSTIDSRVARSDDMAMSYGRRHMAITGGAAEAYYAHLWLRDAQGRWRIAFAILP